MVSEDELEAIHNASLTILEEMGMDFMHPGAREILKKPVPMCAKAPSACALTAT